VLIAIPLGLLKYATDDATLAIAMAHQLAHALSDRPGEDPFDSEVRADSLGIRIAAAAGFEVSVATAYWEGVAAEYPSLIDRERRGAARNRRSPTPYEMLAHGDIARRLEGIRSEIERQSGGPSGGARRQE
jgi:predicted Zn-dependent protease